MDKVKSDPAIKSVSMTRIQDGGSSLFPDLVSVEAPLQMVLRHGPHQKRKTSNLAMTMRTPGHDDLLVTGYLFTENIIHRKEDIVQIRQLQEHEVLIDLREDLNINLLHQERNTYMNSSCGICGKNKLEDIRATIPFMLKKGKPRFHQKQILQWTSLLSGAQRVFPSTGGIHAAALVSADKILAIQEDVGRHNAMDKLIGFALNHYRIPLIDLAIVVSARASFELVQKALMAGVPLLAAVGATSSLAVDLAEENGMTLIGFIKQDRFNIYTHPERVIV